MQLDLSNKALSLPVEVRKQILISLKETDLHKHLKHLFQNMDPESIIEITHGADEYGKDLVLVRHDRFGRSVIAVVVKVGDIRAKTKGRVDEIISQVNQSIAHPVKLKSVSESLRVSDVWVVLDGDISNNASTRLHHEVRVPVRIYDIAWLVDSFSKYYPQVFFEGEITDFLQKKIQELESSHLFGSKNILLSEYFVDPVVAAVDVPVSFDEEQFALVIQEKRIPFSYLASLAKKHRRIILSGDPGVGKSVALRKLAINILRKAANQSLRKSTETIAVPLLIPATEFVKYDELKDLINKYFQIPEIKNRFQISSLFIDGLDEVSPNTRSKVLDLASEFASQLDSSLIITSRKIDIIKSAPSGFEKYELLPFEFGQAVAFFDKLISDSQILGALKDGLRSLRFQIELTPLSLYLLLEIAEAHKELPASIVELYDRYCDIVLGRYDRDKGIEVLFDYVIKKRFLASLAFKEFFQKGRLSIERAEFNSFLEEYANVYGWSHKRFEDFIYEIERSGTLDLQDTHALSFSHRSFLDYFVAYYLDEKRETFEDIDALIVDIYFDDLWSDVALFYVGLRRDIRESVLERIFSYDGEGIVVSINKLLTGRLLQAAWHTPQKSKIKGVLNASAYVVPTKEQFLSMAHSAKIEFPEILADWFVMMLADYSFGSGVLKDVTSRIFGELKESPSYEHAYRMVGLLWASKRFLNEREIHEWINSVLEILSRVPLTPKQESVLLLLLDNVEKNDRALAKTIQKRLRKLGKTYPSLFREILPPPSSSLHRRRLKK